jgi:hypothetical protein
MLISPQSDWELDVCTQNSKPKTGLFTTEAPLDRLGTGGERWRNAKFRGNSSDVCRKSGKGGLTSFGRLRTGRDAGNAACQPSCPTKLHAKSEAFGDGWRKAIQGEISGFCRESPKGCFTTEDTEDTEKGDNLGGKLGRRP